MRKIIAILLLTVLGAACFTSIIAQALAQTTPNPTESTTPPPPIIRWMRYHGNITQWGQEPFLGSVVVNAKTANTTLPFFKPWVTVNAVWSNEKPFPATKPVGGEYTFTHYQARLVNLTEIRKQADFIVNVTGLWNVNKITVTTSFNGTGAPIKTTWEVTPIATLAKGQLHITTNWKNFEIQIAGVNTISGIEIGMMTTTNKISPFSFHGGAAPTVDDLMQISRRMGATPGFGNYMLDLDHNMDSKIDIADLTTVAANM